MAPIYDVWRLNFTVAGWKVLDTPKRQFDYYGLANHDNQAVILSIGLKLIKAHKLFSNILKKPLWNLIQISKHLTKLMINPFASLNLFLKSYM